MKNKSLIFAIIAFAFLGFLYFKQQKEKPEYARGIGSEKIIEIKTNEISRIEAFLPQDKENALDLIKVDSQWQAASRFSAPSVNDKVNDLLETIRKLEGEFRSDSVEILTDYNLSDDSAIHVVLYGNDGKESKRLLIGKGGNYNECFIRLGGSNRVFKATTQLRVILGLYGEKVDKSPETVRWLDLSIFDFDADKVRELVLIADGKEKAYKKPQKASQAPGKTEDDGKKSEKEPKVEYTWEPMKKGEGKAKTGDEIKEIVKTISKLSAEDVKGRGGLADHGLAPAPLVVKLVMDDKKEFKLSVSKVTEKGHFAFRDGSDLVYSLGKRQVERIFGKKDS